MPLDRPASNERHLSWAGTVLWKKNLPAEVAIKTQPNGQNLLLVGDFFLAQSVRPRSGKGFFYTMFTRNTAIVQEAAADFDEEFESTLEDAGIAREESCQAAIEFLDQLIGGA